MPGLVVTTSRKPGGERLAEAAEWAVRLGVPLVAREDRSLEEVAREAGAPGVLVVGGDRVTYREPQRGLSYFYHPGMARRRIRNLQAGHGDPMVTAMGLEPGHRVLDCTLGRGTDAIVAAYAVGPRGQVVGLEKVPVLAELTRHGLATYELEDRDTREAMRRVEARSGDFRDMLPCEPAGAFEVVYFDPLFDQPLERSSGMIPLRALACEDQADEAAVREGLRVARRCVVIKQRAGTPLWDMLPWEIRTVSGGHSRIEYGVIEAGPPLAH